MKTPALLRDGCRQGQAASQSTALSMEASQGQRGEMQSSSSLMIEASHGSASGLHTISRHSTISYAFSFSLALSVAL